jgi:hypothetical protein
MKRFAILLVAAFLAALIGLAAWGSVNSQVCR